MSKPSSARYRTTNGSGYAALLQKRGSLLIWLDKDMTWLAPHDGSPGRPAVFSDAAIQFCRTIRPCAVGRRQWQSRIPYRLCQWAVKRLLDSTGIKFLADGEWRGRKHGVWGDANGARCIWP
jgi:hypothetical protein